MPCTPHYLPMKSNYLLLLASLVFSACFLACTETDSKSEKHPNIIYILADDLGYGDISAFNPGGKILTPNIDEIAAEGMIFTDAHTTSSVCTPSRYSILTGRYSWRTRLKQGVLTGKSKALIPNNRSTLASMLRPYGYHTAFIGKWHLGWDWALKDTSKFEGAGWNATDFDNLDFTKDVANNPNDLGFDYAFGHSGSLDMAPYVYVENGEVTAMPDRITVDTGDYTWWRQGPTGSDFVHEKVTPEFFERSLEHIESRARQGQPFLLYLALPSPHTPILPTEEWLGRSGLNPYADFVMLIDDYIGRMTNLLEELDIEDETILVFTSDNGCSPEANFDLLDSLGHQPSYIYRGHKADIFEGGHRVPFVIKWPDRIAPGSVCQSTVCTTDFFATAAEIVDHSLQDDQGEDSFSMLPLFDNESDGYQRISTVHHSINGSFAIRKGEWKLILCPGSGGWSFPTPKEVKSLDSLSPFQLYNLKDDPGETNNLYEEQLDMAHDLRDELMKLIENGRSNAGPKQPNDFFNGEWHQINFSS